MPEHGSEKLLVKSNAEEEHWNEGLRVVEATPVSPWGTTVELLLIMHTAPLPPMDAAMTKSRRMISAMTDGFKANAGAVQQSCARKDKLQAHGQDLPAKVEAESSPSGMWLGVRA